MPGRTAHAAREAFLAPLRRSLSCITTAQLDAAVKKPGEVEALALSEDPLLLRSARMGAMQLTIGHQYRLVRDGPQQWHVSTAKYAYQLLGEDGRELLAWHWHPGAGTERPHLHAPVEAIGAVSTSRPGV